MCLIVSRGTLELTGLGVAHDVRLFSRDLCTSNGCFVEESRSAVPWLRIWSNYDAQLIFPGCILAKDEWNQLVLNANELFGAEWAKVVHVHFQCVRRVTGTNGERL